MTCVSANRALLLFLRRDECLILAMRGTHHQAILEHVKRVGEPVVVIT
jgi:hypothetical protein